MNFKVENSFYYTCGWFKIIRVFVMTIICALKKLDRTLFWYSYIYKPLRLLALCGLRTLRVRWESPFGRLKELRFATGRLELPFGLLFYL